MFGNENSSEIDESDGSNRRSSDWDVQNAHKNYLSLVLTQIASAAFAFASIWLITKALGSEGYGSVVAVIAASYVAQIFVNWTGVAIVRFGVDEFIETEKIAQAFWLRLFILIPNLLLVLLLSNFWFPPLAAWLKLSSETLWLVFLHFAAMALWVHIQFSLQAVKMPRLQGGLLTIERILVFFSLLILFICGRLDPVSALISYACAALLMIFVGLFVLRAFIFVPISFNWTYLRKILVFSFPLIPFTLSSYLSSSYLDAIFISKFLSIHDLGLYSVATHINGITLQLPTLANNLLLPLFISLQREGLTSRLQHYFKHNFPTFILLWGLFTTIAAFISYFLIPQILGAEFIPSVHPLWILFATSVLSLPPLIGYGSLSNAASTTYIPMISAIVAAIVNIAFNFLLIPLFGLEGCAWATSIMNLFFSLCFFILLRRVEEIPVSWSFWAMIPSIGGAVCLTITGNPYWAMAICLTSAFFVAYFHIASIKETISFLRKLRNR